MGRPGSISALLEDLRWTCARARVVAVRLPLVPRLSLGETVNTDGGRAWPGYARETGRRGSLYSSLVSPVWAWHRHPSRCPSRVLHVILTSCTLYPSTSNPSQISLGYADFSTPSSSALASSGHHHLSPVPLLRPLCFVICWQAKVMALKPKSDHGHQNPPPIPWSSFCGSLLLLQALEHRFQCPW